MKSTSIDYYSFVLQFFLEIDEEKIEAFGGTISLPFTAGKNVAVKIIDARGIESLKIIRL